MFRFMFVALLLAGGTAVAQDAAKTAIEGFHVLAPTAKVQSVTPAPIPGFYAIVASGHPFYVSADGKFLIEGHVYDIAAKRDLIEDSLIGIRKEAFAAIPAEKKITFAPPHPKHRVIVFTDVDCPYCRQFHKQIADYNKDGIAVDYLLYPLPIHKGADVKAVTVWCSKDRNSTFTQVINGENPPAKTCDNPVGDVIKIAESAGVTGTPAIFAEDGTQLGGYLPPDQLAKRLDDLDKSKSAAAN